MIYDLLALLSSFVASTIEALGYGGIFILMAAESAGIPIPSELIMPFSGFLVAGGVFTFWGIVLAGVLGNLAGSLIFYWIGFRFGRPFIERYGNYFLIHMRDVELAERWFLRWGGWAVFVGRLLPAVRTYISFPAGVARMNLWTFTVYSTLGILPFVLLVGWIGVRLGEEWHSIEHYFRKFDYAIAAVILAGLAWWIGRHVRHTRDAQSPPSSL